MLSVTELEQYISNNIDGVRPSITDLEYYRQAIGADNYLRINNMAAKEILGDAIIFVSDRPNYFFLRLSVYLLKKGIKTVLLSRWGVEKEQESFFDYIILYDKILDLKYLSNCTNCKIYVQAWVGWNFLPVYIQLISGQKVACNINDLTNLLFDEKRNLSLIGLSDKDTEIDLLCEKYILENFSFITLPYSLEILRGISSNLDSRFDKNIFYLPCHASPSFFYQETNREITDPIHLLYVGGVPPDHKPDSVFRDQKLRGIVNDLLDSQYLVTILNNPQLSRNKNKIEDIYPYFTKLAENNVKFKFKNGFPPWKLKDYTKHFHYGLMLYSFDEILISKKHYQNIVPTKFFTYIEQCLPVIVIDELSAVSKLVNDNGLGVVVNRKSVKKLYNILIDLKDEYEIYIDNINKYRQKYNIDIIFDKILPNLRGNIVKW